MTQSSLLRAALPASLFGVLLALAAPQSATPARYRTTRDENFRQQPGPDQRLLGIVRAGTELAGGDLREGWREVTLDGWIWSASVGSTDRDGFDLGVSAPNGENLRSEPNGRVIARLASGFLLDEVTRDNGWVHVRRTGWMWDRSLSPVVPGAPVAASDDTPGVRRSDAGEGSLDHGMTVDQTELRRTPDGDVAGSLVGETPVRVVARSGEWVKVAAEGWIKESDLKPSAAGVLVGVSGAEVRARPKDFEGKVVQWTVQFIAVQSADEWRQEIPPGRRYMLARGPLPEVGFVYVTLTPEQLAQAERLQPLAQLVMLARIRVGRSAYLGNPVVDLVDMSVREP